MEIAGWQILPETYYRHSPAAFTKSVTEDLKRSILFVQLLGQYTTQQTKELPRGYEGLQLELAKKEDKPILRWFDPNLDLSLVKNQALLEQEFYMKMPYEDFKEEVKRRAQIYVANRERTTSDYDDYEAYALVNASDEDCDLRDYLCKILYNEYKIGYDTHSPKESYSLSDLTESQDYSIIIIIYGQCSKELVKDQTRKCRTILLQRKNRPLVCGIYIGPPPDEPSSNNKLPPIVPPKFHCLYMSKEFKTSQEFQKFIEEVKKQKDDCFRQPI